MTTKSPQITFLPLSLGFYIFAQSMSRSLPYTLPKGPLTKDFLSWLKRMGYARRLHLSELVANSQNSYGGRQFEGQNVRGSVCLKLIHRPIFFIHGNSDGALAQGVDEWSQGWSANIQFLLNNGYTSAEMYAITYGDRSLANSLKRSLNCSMVLKMRLFMEALLEYTNSERVDIVAHSMGVTLARIIIQGKTFTEKVKGVTRKCHVGRPLMSRVNKLIGIAGANFGMCLCSNESMVQQFAACGKNGYWTSSACPELIKRWHNCREEGPPLKCRPTNSNHYSAMLAHLNKKEHPKEAKQIVSIWSQNDSILGGSNLAWGHRTSLIPRSDRSIICDGSSHFSLKWDTLEEQLAILQTD